MPVKVFIFGKERRGEPVEATSGEVRLIAANLNDLNYPVNRWLEFFDKPSTFRKYAVELLGWKKQNEEKRHDIYQAATCAASLAQALTLYANKLDEI